MRDQRGREQLGRVMAQMDALDKQTKNKPRWTSAEMEQWNRLLAEHDRISNQVCKNEGVSSLWEAKIRDLGNGGDPAVADLDLPESGHRMGAGAYQRNDPHTKVFTKYIRNGMEALEPDERQMLRSRYIGNSMGGRPVRVLNAQSVGTGSQGGYVVPQGFSYQLEEAMKWWGGIDGVTGEFWTDAGNPFPWPTVNDTTNMGRLITENQQVNETDVAFNQVTFNAYIASSDLVLVPVTLLEDSAFDIDALLARLLGIRLGRLRNYYCTLGSGNTQPMGIVTAVVAAGNILTLGTGNTQIIAYDDLVNLEHEVDPAYRYNPSTRWMFNDATLKVLKKLVDGNNRPLWSPGLTASFQDGPSVQIGNDRPTILGHQYIVNPNMASPAANAYTVLFGDMNTFKVRRVKDGITVMRLVERYADYLQQGFLAWERFDSNLIDAGTHPIAVLQQSAT